MPRITVEERWIGKVFGDLEIVDIDKEKSSPERTFVICKCLCGNNISIRTDSLQVLKNKDCGCKEEEFVLKSINNFNLYLIETYYKKHERRVVIQTKAGYKADVTFVKIMNHNGNFNFVDKSNPYSLENIIRWLKNNNKNFELCKNNKYDGNNKNLTFYCYKCKEEFYTSWSHIYNGANCSVCQGYQVRYKTSFGYRFPKLMLDWADKNIIDPYTINMSYKKNVFWKCHICDYEWENNVDVRVQGKSGCSSCSGQVLTDRNRLSIRFPKIAKEWHPTLNGDLTPRDVSFGTKKKVWWLCKNCNKPYFSAICKRASKDSRGCPKCNESKGEKEISKFLNYYNISFSPQHTFKDLKGKGGKAAYKFDFYLSNYILICEYHGPQHYFPVDFAGKGQELAEDQFKQIQYKDKIKEQYCLDNNIPLIIIPYTDFKNIELILTEYLNL